MKWSRDDRAVSIEVIHFLYYGILITSTLRYQTFSSFHSALGKIASAYQRSSMTQGMPLKAERRSPCIQCFLYQGRHCHCFSKEDGLGASYLHSVLIPIQRHIYPIEVLWFRSYHCGKQDGGLCFRPFHSIECWCIQSDQVLNDVGRFMILTCDVQRQRKVVL